MYRTTCSLGGIDCRMATSAPSWARSVSDMRLRRQAIDERIVGAPVLDLLAAEQHAIGPPLDPTHDAEALLASDRRTRAARTPDAKTSWGSSVMFSRVRDRP